MPTFGLVDEIIAIKQFDNLTIIQTAAVDIVVNKPIDNITIKDVEDVLSGVSSLEVNIVARKQSDDITIKRPAGDDLTIKT